MRIKFINKKGKKIMKNRKKLHGYLAVTSLSYFSILHASNWAKVLGAVCHLNWMGGLLLY
ncbi:hypothetical protein NRS6085_11835 [Bacillus subtilis]|nr:hypothetical protein NRS6085_04133 [Bacillus subtilis]CAI6276921.1 hypothetical protein NRS6085_11835 [Bacillus subtilis]